MISAVTVQLGQTLGHGVSVQTGKVIISTPAATTMKMTAVTVQRVKNWDWSRYYARRALPSLKAKLSLEKIISIPIFSTALTISAAVSAPMTRCCRPICAAMRQMFLAWRTAAQSDHQPDGPGNFTKPAGSRRAIPHSGYRRFCLWHTTRPC